MPPIDQPYATRPRVRPPRVKRKPKRAPIYVPPPSLAPKAERRAAARAPAHYTYTPPKPKGPTPRQQHLARLQRHEHVAQGRAVRREAKVQRALGPGKVVPLTRGGSLHKRAAAQAQGQYYASLGRAVSHAAAQQRIKRATEGTAKVGGSTVPKVLLSKDPKVLRAAGFHGPNLADALAAAPLKAIANVPKDVAELAVTLPTSLAHLGVEGTKLGLHVAAGDLPGAAKQATKIGKEQLQPYKQAIKHPLTFATEHPVTSYLMFSPGLKAPGLIAGKVARLAGKQTLERTAAELPGTALKATRRGSRDVFARRRQAREDRGRAAPTVSQRELNRRVDEQHDLNRHFEQQTVAEHTRAAHQATKGRPRQVRMQAMADAEEAGREQARVESRARDARQFGANVEPSTSIHQVHAAKQAREQARLDKRRATKARERADKQHAQARANARAARGRAPRTPLLTDLRAQRKAAQRELKAAQRHAVAPGRIKAARDRVRELDRRIGAQQQRVAGVPPAEADALRRAIGERDQALAVEQATRDKHAFLKRAHIDLDKLHRQSALVNPADEGRLFDNPQDAKRVVYQLNQQGHAIPEGELPGALKHVQVQAHVLDPAAQGPRSIRRSVKLTRGAGTRAHRFKMVKVGDDRWAVLPQTVAQRMYGGGGREAYLSHASVGSGKATAARGMRVSRRNLTKSTLPFSFKWLAGQGIEAGVRSLTGGAGPADWLRMRAVAKRMNQIEPGSGDAFMTRLRGGQFDPGGAVAEQLGRGKTAEEEFRGTPLHLPAAVGTAAAESLPGRAVAAPVRGWTRAVMGTVNGFIERHARQAMGGHAIKHGPLMEKRMVGLTEKAIDQAARGLKGTPEQVQAVRAVDNAYGRYSKWSPEMRSLLMHWTPFLPWYLNVGKYLFHTLPVEHPFRTALLANLNAADQQWREKNRLSFYGKHRLPGFLMGGYPAGGDRYYRVAHYTPWGIGSDVTGAAAGLVLPQLETPILNALGVDYLGRPLTKVTKRGKQPFSEGEKSIKALSSVFETQVPGFGLAGRLTGLGPRLVDKRSNVPATLSERAQAELPWTPTRPKSKRKRSSGGGLGGGLGGGGLGGGLR